MVTNPDVVVLGPDYPDSFADNIASSIGDCGLACALIDARTPFAKAGTMSGFSKARHYLEEAVHRTEVVRRAFIDRSTARRLSQIAPKLIISTWGYFEAAQITLWRAATPDAIWVLWYPDSIANLGRQQMLEAPYDHLFFKDRFIVDLLTRRTSLSVHLLPQACNPSRHRTETPRDAEEARRYQSDVAIVGNIYPYRALLLEEMSHAYDVKIFGNLYPNAAKQHPWMVHAFTGEYVSGRTKAVAFGSTKIVLNTLHYAELAGSNLRLFEATACGGFVLTHGIPGLEEYFRPSHEVVTFDTPNDLREALTYYLAHDAERTAIALAGQTRAHRDHTYSKRLSELFRVCGLDFEPIVG
jgi:spore maturation protein CgeB